MRSRTIHSTCYLTAAGLLIALFADVRADSNIISVLSRESELTIFRDRVSGVSWLSFLEEEGKITIFAPTNVAIDKFDRNKFDKLSGDDSKKPWLRNFFVQVRIQPKELPNEQSSFAKGAPKLFFSHYKEDPSRFYVNEALVIRKSPGSTESITVYLIDIVPNFSTFENSFPSADEVLQNTDKIAELKGITVLGFRGRVNYFGVRDSFGSATPSTFFIPIGNFPIPALSKNLVLAHVIPGRVLFTTQFGNDHYPTLSSTSEENTQGARIEVSLVNETIADLTGAGDHHDNHFHYPRHYEAQPPAYILLIKSTQKGPASIGSVLSRIILANVPVSNGVIHFINSPLGLITQSVVSYIQDPKHNMNRFNLFTDILKQSPQFMAELNEKKSQTLFVPTNQAVSVLPNDVWTQYKSNKTELFKLLRYHLVPQRTLTEEGLARSGAETATSAAGVPLVLRRVQCTTGCAYNSGTRSELVVECAGVNGSVVSANIAATDGVIHLVDRVLGAPSHSLGWKLQKEESLTTTQVVATKGLWNKVLDQPTSRFTLMAPDNRAWQRVNENYPSEYKRLVQLPSEAHVQAARVMDRHLAEGEFTRDDLTKMSGIKMRNGETIDIERLPGDQMRLKWNGDICNFVRNDLQATNGVIHIIDCVMMTRRDLIASSAPQVNSAGNVLLMIAPLLLAIFAART
ncbi:fasciclin-1-like isoform X2 [Varroa jacobsoni]|uniref:FAS1 domain-containing protein n=2 Tax=Varroa TaxID=62624 RepID=A0A7M7MIC5_VARDE|nr:fasciclin-1-like [Varroa destructor]XP_022688336.1 fasciclin-1-like isoform X2 [Varroa jacobsoni]XP_022688337.1 fasciclin-1-like isoform X2 [Varroa jacobsoni]XP_022688338.1 fasciclin-1-like isoform X2 [Varroa jacobsoni]XP_022688339.1 fasciclin-1-like isoform X2 [Varroa jacobsoni]XP_022688340.1 fasciclin-1-like isoform X2 [Varroa jacobsoni]XP_022688342.1 fasciclin-1-like isoform X2 [Varroa jacobsoni]